MGIILEIQIELKPTSRQDKKLESNNGVLEIHNGS